MQHALLNLVAVPLLASQMSPNGDASGNGNLLLPMFAPSPRAIAFEIGNLPSSSRNSAFSSLDTIKTFRDGWDGPNSKPAMAVDIEAASIFISSIPESISSPEVSMANDGEISVSWRDQGFFVDLSFFKGQILLFARMHGDRLRAMGTWASFDQLPNAVKVAMSGVGELVV